MGNSIKYSVHEVDPDSVKKDSRFPKPKDPNFPEIVEVILRDPVGELDEEMKKRLKEENDNFARIYKIIEVTLFTKSSHAKLK